ncbi:MAG: response regulator [Dehalococcoidia bacterium]|jgi:two-component system KDP operon response regulator KdpE
MGDNGPRVLVVDDEQAIRRFLHVALTSQGYEVFEASSGLEALSTAANYRPDIIIIDLGLPDIDGIDVTKLFRQVSKIPIIVLSVRGSENDKIAALDAGADDYLTKPFGVGELLARLRANLRRSTQPATELIFVNGDLSVDLEKRLVTVSGREVQLTPTEYDLLKMLVTHAGKVLTHNHLLREVWGTGYEQEFHILHVNVSNLRRKVEPDPSRPRFIITEPGVGYRLKTP